MNKHIKNFLKLGVPLWLMAFLWPNRRQKLPFFFDDWQKPYNIAHRGGAALAPEETLVAFTNAEKVGANMFEYDVHITKDGHLIASHDPTVDRITTGSGRINELTLTEIKQFDAGEKFVDLKGGRPYKDKGVTLATVEEIFQHFPYMPAVIELKDTNNPVYYEAMVQEMWRLIQQYNMQDKVIIASFDHAINQRFQEISNGQVAIGGGESEAQRYIVKLLLRLNGIIRTDAQAFQLPLEQHNIDLTQRNIIKGSQRLGIDVYYWTINDDATMRQLIRRDVDGIMSDNPALLSRVLKEELQRREQKLKNR